MKNTNVHKYTWYTWYTCLYKITKYVSINKTQHRPSIRYRQSMYYNRFLIFQLFQKKTFFDRQTARKFLRQLKVIGRWVNKIEDQFWIKDSNRIQSELFHICFTFLLKFAIRNIFWKAVESQVSQQINWRIVETYAFCR